MKLKNRSVAEFLKIISEKTSALEEQNIDTARFLSKFSYKLVSTKKISTADTNLTLGTRGTSFSVVERKVNPNLSHPLREMDVLNKIGDRIYNIKFTRYVFRAIAIKYEIKSKPHLFWKSNISNRSQYSNDMVTFINKLSEKEILQAIDEYKLYLKKNRKKK